MAVLSDDAKSFLKGFFERALERHASGAVTTESVVNYLTLAIDAVDRQKPDEIEYMRAVLEDAWREDDA